MACTWMLKKVPEDETRGLPGAAAHEAVSMSKVQGVEAPPDSDLAELPPGADLGQARPEAEAPARAIRQQS